MFIQKLIPGSALLCVAFTLALLTTGCNSNVNNSPANVTGSNANTNAVPADTTQASSNAPTAKLNINTASETDFLRAIPDLGSRMVHEFEEYRPYKSIRQFRAEIGKYVDQNKVAEYEKYIFVPIDENRSDAATLQQIPGLDANEAQQLIAGRPYASREAFLAKLTENVSADELAIAKTYMVQQ
jgi:DNA uptake protein ComE-like DNA-binding protein